MSAVFAFGGAAAIPANVSIPGIHVCSEKDKKNSEHCLGCSVLYLTWPQAATNKMQTVLKTISLSRKPDKSEWLFLLFWFVLNLLQASLMDLTSDEAYYWFYAQHLQWGYYDHPPMLAAMIKAGSFLFPGEIGVRFFNVVFSTASLYPFFCLLPARFNASKKTFLVLLAAPLLHYLTFLVFPDGPLLFCSLLFLFLYQRFLQNQTWSKAVLLGLSLALMAYAKYHGALVLVFTVLANPRLLRSRYFYCSLLIAAGLFFPHLWWQYQNGFPTLNYHLSGRTGAWSFRHVGEYLSQQIVAIGPGLIFLPFVIRTTNLFERTLKFIITGTFLFFLVSSFKTFVHFHWTSIALFPLLYFAVDYYQQSQKKKLFNVLLLPFLIIFFAVRILLLFPIIPNMHAGEDYYHGRKQWAKDIEKVAGNRHVLIPNNLREASLYSFYATGKGVTLYNRPGKKSQYELWGYEDSLQGKEVVFAAKYLFAGSAPLPNSLQPDWRYAVLPSFRSYYTGISVQATVTQTINDSLEVNVTIVNHRSTPLHFSKTLHNDPASLIMSFEKGKQIIGTFVLKELATGDVVAPGNSIQRTAKISIRELPSEEYQVYVGIRSGVLPDAILSNEIPLAIKQ